MKLAVIGCGYVGLVSGACLAEAGHDVVATDNDHARIAALQAGKIPIYEPNLDKVLESVVREGRLRFTADGAEAVRSADVIFICVGTPPTESGEADLSAIDNVARMIAKESRGPKLVIEKSTVPAQTGEQLKKALEVYAGNPGAKFRVASNPEFLREGTAVEDFFHPDRIVIGVEEKESEEQLRESEDKFKQIFQLSFDAIAINTLPRLEYIDANEAFARIVGVPREELIGKTPDQIGVFERHRDGRGEQAVDQHCHRLAVLNSIVHDKLRDVDARLVRGEGWIRGGRVGQNRRALRRDHQERPVVGQRKLLRIARSAPV